MNSFMTRLYCECVASVYRYANAMLFIFGVILITSSLTNLAVASNGQAMDIIKEQLCNIMELLEGPFGALMAIVAGLAAVVAASMGGYKLAVSCLVIACGSYIVRSLVLLFFGDSVLTKCSTPCTR